MITFGKRNPALLAWVVLVAATLVSWWLGDGHGDPRPASVGVIAVAFLKVYVVGRYFMELRAAPPQLHLAFAAWCVIVPAILIGLYLAL